MNENYNDCHHRKTTRTFLYTQKAKKIAELFYTQKARHFSKSYTIPVMFLYTKSHTLDVTGFSWNFWSWNYIQKSWHFSLREVFIYKKLETSQKAKQFAMRFYIPKSGTFALRNFTLNFWNLRRGGGHLQCTLRDIFIFWKTMNFALRWCIQRAWHYVLHFNIQKTIHFSLRFYIYNLSCSPDT